MPVYTLRPNAINSTLEKWTEVPGGDGQGAIVTDDDPDSPNTSDYIEDLTDLDIARVYCDTFTLAPNETVVRVTHRAYARQGTGTTCQIRIIREGNDDGGALLNSNLAGSTDALYVTDWYGTCSQADVDGMNLEAVTHTTGSVTHRVYAWEIEIETVFDFPTQVGFAMGNDTSSLSTHTPSHPTVSGGISKGDLLLGIINTDDPAGTVTHGWPGGWTELADNSGAAAGISLSVAWMRATGGETGTFNVTSSTAAASTFHVHCFRGCDPFAAPVISAGTAHSVGSFGADVADLTVPWGARENIWVAICGLAGDTDPNALIQKGPTDGSGVAEGFTSTWRNRWADFAGTGLGSCYRALNVATLDPAPFYLGYDNVTAHTFLVGLPPMLLDLGRVVSSPMRLA